VSNFNLFLLNLANHNKLGVIFSIELAERRERNRAIDVDQIVFLDIFTVGGECDASVGPKIFREKRVQNRPGQRLIRGAPAEIVLAQRSLVCA